MNKLKQWVALTLVGILAVLAAGWFLLISPKRSEAADLRSQAAAKLSANQQLMTQLAMLKAQAKGLPAQQAKLAAVAAKIPDNAALPAMVRALTKAAAAAGVELVSIAPGLPTPVAAPASTAVVPSAAAGQNGSSAATSKAVVPGAAAASSAAGLQAISLSLNVVGGYFQLEQFLDRLEGLSRAFKVTAFTLAPGANPVKAGAATANLDTGSSLLGVVTGSVYVSSGHATATSAVPTTAK
jgi:type IV pilus assembly protein PilO